MSVQDAKFELTHIEAIRILSGIVQLPDDKDKAIEHLTTLLAVINLTARNMIGLASDDFTDQTLLKLGVKLKREKDGDQSERTD